MSEKQPGAAWMEIIQRASLEEFAASFTHDARLDLSVADEPLVGPAAIREFFNTTRTMYDSIGFSSETSTAGKTFLEWQGVFQGVDVAGVTVLTLDARDLIESVALYHRPLGQVIAFAEDLSKRQTTR
ncbi:nuclear transport factor 2 family protein [Streptomyces sp. NPDC090080]|uniref:nuclear transport factor 2 family protein n=1 Tax=Streptomyces sp. NPDC090080 TaxID=3365939 RepID=UPI00382C9721